jgi:hypothetical protein
MKRIMTPEQPSLPGRTYGLDVWNYALLNEQLRAFLLPATKTVKKMYGNKATTDSQPQPLDKVSRP